MISRCDVCGKIFDTDVEVGTVKDGTTYCESCAVDAGVVDYEDNSMNAEEEIISLLNGESATEESSAVSQTAEHFEKVINNELKKNNLEAFVELDDDNWFELTAPCGVDKAMKVIDNAPAVKSGGLIPEIIEKFTNFAAKIGLLKATTQSLAAESFQSKFIGSNASYEEVVLGHNEKGASLDEVLRLAERIGLRTLGDLEEFLRREQLEGETILGALQRYNEGLGDEYDEVAAARDVDGAEESAKEELTDEQLEQIAVAVSRACDDFEENHKGLKVIVDQDGQAGDYSTKFYVYDEDEILLGSSDEISDEQAAAQPDPYAYFYKLLEEVSVQKANNDFASLSTTAKEFLEDSENAVYTELISKIETKFELRGKDLTKKNDLTDYVIDNILFTVPYPKKDYEEEDEVGEMWYADLDDVDYEKKITQLDYEVIDGQLAMRIELSFKGDVTLQTASRDSGNYYEPPEWDEKEATATATAEIIVKFNGTDNEDEWDFPGDIDLEDVEVE